jgi:hypothetical protein
MADEDRISRYQANLDDEQNSSEGQLRLRVSAEDLDRAEGWLAKVTFRDGGWRSRRVESEESGPNALR